MTSAPFELQTGVNFISSFGNFIPSPMENATFPSENITSSSTTDVQTRNSSSVTNFNETITITQIRTSFDYNQTFEQLYTDNYNNNDSFQFNSSSSFGNDTIFDPTTAFNVSSSTLNSTTATTSNVSSSTRPGSVVYDTYDYDYFYQAMYDDFTTTTTAPLSLNGMSEPKDANATIEVYNSIGLSSNETVASGLDITFSEHTVDHPPPIFFGVDNTRSNDVSGITNSTDNSTTPSQVDIRFRAFTPQNITTDSSGSTV